MKRERQEQGIKHSDPCHQKKSSFKAEEGVGME